ncbi:centromere protein H isoform X2 [Rhinatrema bivittatum]|uniref:centromere protein H isoform X2 n=1 Tax=Rhinatrema bivittatum TaxID=194408 RepID=UPI00112E3F87|nr:centromere protein H isoform X2 [Rhinatrema bivittatum]
MEKPLSPPVLDSVCEQLGSVRATQAPVIRLPTSLKEDFPKLLSLGEQVGHQCMEYCTVVEAGEESVLDLIPEEKLMETAKELEREIEKARTSCHNKTLVLQRMILEVVKHSLTLCSSILKSQQEARALEEQLFEIRKKRLTLKEIGVEKLLQLQIMKKKRTEELEDMESEKLKRTRYILKKEIEMSTLVQNVFQNIIIGSRVNWAEDPQLKAIVLKLEKTPEFD